MAPHTAVPRRADDVVASARRNEGLMRQLDESLEEERTGARPVPFRQIQEEAHARRAARDA